MGITGLLPYLRKIHRPVNISEFEGCTVAVDAYCWLHKGAFSCAEKLAYGEHTDQYVYYCMKYVDCMLKKKIKPILVFDGCHLPSKGDVEKARRERRESYRKKAAVFLREGKRNEAKECLQRCVDITADMALKLMETCRKHGVDCIVAPYEADAQLAYLNKVGIAQVIVTEDSDLLPFGCDKVLFKMDFFGNGTLIEKSRLNEVLQIRDDVYTFDKFRHMCIISGCDYLPSLPGIGLSKANKVLKMARQPDLKIMLKKIPSYLKMKLVVTDEYVENFLQADNTFLYQLVFNPVERRLVPLTPYQPDMDPAHMKYAGPYISEAKALQIALGNLDVNSGNKIGQFDPDIKAGTYQQKKGFAFEASIWDINYKVQNRKTLKEITFENASLHEKEIIVNTEVIKRKSPVKRKRDAVESEEVKCDSELISLYDDKEPDGKRLRTERVDLSPGSEVGNVTSTTSCKSPQKTRKLSVTAADVWTVAASSVEKSLPAEEKEAPVKTKHNRFALLSSTQRSRFNLNVQKTEVRSRYFAQKEDILQIEMAKTAVKSDDVKAGSYVKTDDDKKENDAETAENETDQQNVSVESLHTADKSLHESFVSSSPAQGVSKSSSSTKSAFSWTRFAVSTTRKHFSSEGETQELQSEKSGSKSVVSETVSANADTVVITDEIEEVSVSASNLNSSPSTLSFSSSALCLMTPPSVPKTSAFSKGNSSGTPGRSKCRVSGLARGKKKSSPIDKDKQKSIKDMFSKFSYTSK